MTLGSICHNSLSGQEEVVRSPLSQQSMTGLRCSATGGWHWVQQEDGVECWTVACSSEFWFHHLRTLLGFIKVHSSLVWVICTVIPFI